MSSAPATAPSRSRRWPWVVVAALGLAAAGGGAWWYLRPREPAPEPPVVDLSRAEPEVAQAINSALDQVRARPRDAAAWGKLGMLLLAHDFESDSTGAFRTAAKLDPDNYRWPYLEGLTRVLYEPEAGLERLRRAAELAPANRPEPRLRLAEALLERGDLDGAAGLAESVAQGAPGNGRAQLVLARVAAARGDWPAVLARTAACAEEPNCRRAAALLRGEALAARGERERADAEFRQAAELPEDQRWPDPVVTEVEELRVGTRARLAKAGRKLEEGWPLEAVSVLEDAVRRAPDDPAPALMLGEVHIQARNPAGARKVLEEFVTRFPGSVEGWFNLGVARFQLDDFTKAADAFRQVTKLKPDHALAHYNLGHCHRKLGDRAAAKAAFEEALRCRPDHQPSRQALADLEAGK